MSPHPSTPPGWEEDTTYGDQNLVTVLVPKNRREDEFIYISTMLSKPGSALEDDISEYQKAWTAKHHDSLFVKRDDIVPSELQNSFVVYECKNPSLPKQPLEFVAFTRRSIALVSKNNEFTFQIVLTGNTKKSVEGGLATLEVLLAHF